MGTSASAEYYGGLGPKFEKKLKEQYESCSDPYLARKDGKKFVPLSHFGSHETEGIYSPQLLHIF